MPQNDTNQVRKPSSQILEHLRKCSAEHKDEVSTSSTAPFLTVIKTDGEPYALRDARTVRGEALGNLFDLCQIRRPLPTPLWREEQVLDKGPGSFRFSQPTGRGTDLHPADSHRRRRMRKQVLLKTDW